ncbi:MAG: flagellar assembly protein FliH [Myxococcaceae bacterium]|nr:flagellar assembly protein FliH [Myxococcaceae bacterium]
MAIGKVIKGDSGPEPVSDPRAPVRAGRPGVVNSEVFEAHQSANAIIEDAKKKAQEILEAAQAEREKVLAEAREAGRQEGLGQVTEQILRAKLLKTEVLQNAEREIVALACRIAEKIIGHDVERSPELVTDIVANAVENVRTAQQVVLRVNPKDAAILREKRARMMEQIGRVKEIAIKEDADIPRLGCIIETEAGTIDAQLATQLEMIRNVLIGDPAKKEGPA